MQNFWDRWGGWIIKLMAILIAAGYVVIISIGHNSPYVWLSLILVLMLCLTMLAYTRDTPIIRWSRRNDNPATTNNQNEEPEMTEVSTAIWMTDIPPSYSFVMETNAPVTPPPSYGSAILMFPWIATGQQSPDASRLLQTTKFRSVSRQVSECSGIYNGTLSRQTSRVDTLSTSLCNGTLSRQTSRQDDVSTTRQLSAISRQISQVTLMSRQISMQECKQNQQNTKLQEEEEEEEEERNDNDPSTFINLDYIVSQLENEPPTQENRSEVEENVPTVIVNDNHNLPKNIE